VWTVYGWNKRGAKPAAGRRGLREYLDYYEKSRTHLGLAKDCPVSRAVEPPERGEIIAIPHVGGLHHRYTRRAA
jgi:putative transposase